MQVGDMVKGEVTVPAMKAATARVAEEAKAKDTRKITFMTKWTQ
jgi:hypothetical protein